MPADEEWVSLTEAAKALNYTNSSSLRVAAKQGTLKARLLGTAGYMTTIEWAREWAEQQNQRRGWPRGKKRPPRQPPEAP